MEIRCSNPQNDRPRSQNSNLNKGQQNPSKQGEKQPQKPNQNPQNPQNPRQQ